MSSVFDRHQKATIEAATARIIPADRDSGALEAGVIDYIERALSDYARRSLPLYREGVRELDGLAREKFSAESFLSLPPADQDQVLAALEQRKSLFFEILLQHTMEGFYGDPRHGGNKDRAGWKLIGFPGPAHPKGYEPPLGWYDANEPDEFSPRKKS